MERLDQDIQIWLENRPGYYKFIQKPVTNIARLQGRIAGDPADRLPCLQVDRPAVLLIGTIQYKRKYTPVWVYEDLRDPNGTFGPWTPGPAPDCFIADSPQEGL